eukprot:TRINITY_DN20220_c0_g2_i1.p1 TRINITY_DN20220_c0_g2~~TRINITY_DN20220_c0_g2_i1.p1  ORF type:complete len:1299 (+),score=332.46 TRINITY_DN20220_c0_g2_i1:72-3968(+)
MEIATLQQLCIQLCDPDVAAARSAARSLADELRQTNEQGLRAGGFECAFAPLLSRLADEKLPVQLQQDFVVALTALLRRASPEHLPGEKAGRVFGLSIERLLTLLETWLPHIAAGAVDEEKAEVRHRSSAAGKIETATAKAAYEDAAVETLSCAGELLKRWYACRRNVAPEVSKMHLGFLTHLAVAFLQGSQRRELSCQSACVLEAVAAADGDADILACFYPGVCTALAKSLLQADFKLGSRAVVAACGAWAAWIVNVLGDAANADLLEVVPEQLSLDKLFADFNARSVAGAAGALLAGTDSKASKELDAARGSGGGGLPQLQRDKQWLSETAAHTGEALSAVLGVSKSSVHSVWMGTKAPIRRAFLELSASMLEKCPRVFTGTPAAQTCLECIFAALADDDEANKSKAEAFLQRTVLAEAGEVHGHMLPQVFERLVVLLRELAPSPAGQPPQGFAQRLAYADGFLRFLNKLKMVSPCHSADAAAGPGFHISGGQSLEAIVDALLRLCALNSEGMERTLQDTRSLVTLPTSRSRPDLFVSLFPYGYMDADEESNAEAMVAVRASTKEGVQEVLQTGGEGEEQQLTAWLRRGLRVSGGDKSTAADVAKVVASTMTVFDPAAAFSIVFDDMACGWAAKEFYDDMFYSTGVTADKAASETAKPQRLSRRTAALFVLGIWLKSCEEQEIRLPSWILRHCVSLATSCLPSERSPQEQAAETLKEGLAVAMQGACAMHMLGCALSALAFAGALDVHAQVKNVLLPLLACLGSASLVASTAARAVLVNLHGLLLRCGRLQEADADQDPVQALLASYADYVVADICFKLKFETMPASGQSAFGLSAVLVAVVQHMDLQMLPLVTDVVHALLNADFDHKSTSKAAAPWVMQVLASIVQQLAQLICERRRRKAAVRDMQPTSSAAGRQGVEDHLPASEAARPSMQTPSSLVAFLTGMNVAWRPMERSNGFIVSDLGACLDEDPPAPEAPEDALDYTKKPSLYDKERRLASSILLWARGHLQASAMQRRHLAHVAIVHSLTVLSTRTRDLLPRVHDVWASVAPSFCSTAPLAVQADACIFLKHVARLSGDFVRQRFLSDCWPGLWSLLQNATPVGEEDAKAWSPALKAQSAALDALAFIAGDAVLIATVTEQLTAIALKFMRAAVSRRLRGSAKTLMKRTVVADCDMVWCCCQSLGLLAVSVESASAAESTPAATMPCTVPSLLQVGLKMPFRKAMSDEDLEFLRNLLDGEAAAMRPRVQLGLGGQLWADFLQLQGSSAGQSPPQEDASGGLPKTECTDDEDELVREKH